MHCFQFVPVIASLLFVSACHQPTGSHAIEAADPAPKAKPQYGNWGVETDGFSKIVSPTDDIYGYVNADWLKTTEMPAGHSLYNAAWETQYAIYSQIDALMQSVLAQENAPGSAEKRVADFYTSLINRDAIEVSGLTPIAADLQAISQIDSHEGVAAWMGKSGSTTLFHSIVQPPVDMKGAYVFTLAQYRVTGLGLPGQNYYKSNEQEFADHRAAYAAYIQATLENAGVGDADEKAEAVLDLETRFANVMWSFEQLRDAGANFNLVERDELDAYAPGFPWDAFLATRGVTDIDRINIGAGAIQESAALFRQIPVETWKAYLAFHWTHDRANMLPQKFRDARFEFFDQRLGGVAEEVDAKDAALEQVERYLGDDMGSLYVQSHFRESDRQSIEEIAVYIRKAFRERLQATEWMDAATKAEAIAKLDAIIIEIAEPGLRADLSSVQTAPADPIQNVANIRAAQWAFQRDRIGKPITRLGDWNMPPHSIGMGYHQQYNKIFITAGFLQPPFFDPNADVAVNFGAIGHTLGHEFGHALDDQGSKFDQFGALRDWWSPQSRAAYEERTAALIDQYKQYASVPGANLRAEQMIGEIVGDLTGVSIAHRAYELYVEDHYNGTAPLIDGFTGSQRFYLSLAQQARTIATEQRHRSIALHASHPPGKFRVNGVVTNIDSFYESFDVQPDAKLYKPEAERISLW